MINTEAVWKHIASQLASHNYEHRAALLLMKKWWLLECRAVYTIEED